MTGSIKKYIFVKKSIVTFIVVVILLEVPAQLVYPFVWLFIVDVVISDGKLALLLPATAVWFGVQVLEQVLRVIRTLLTERLGLSFSREAREAVHHQLLYSQWRELESQRSGDLVARFGPDIDAVEQFLSNESPTFLIQILGFTLVIGALVWINPLLATVVVIPVVVVAIVARRFNATVGPRYQVAAAKLGDMSATFEEDATGVRAIQALSAEKVRHAGMVDLAQQLYASRMSIVRNRIMAENIAGFIGFSGTVGMMSLGGYLVVEGNMTLGGLVAFLGYAWRLPVGVNIIISGVDFWNRAKAASLRLQDILDREYSRSVVREAPEIDSVKGEINFNVDRFVYPSRTEPALSQVAFSARPGDIVCLVGPSGSGKSTILSLVAGFYQPDINRGQVEIDGYELRENNSRSYRRFMAVVLQDTFIWNDTVEANIRMGVREARSEEVENAARFANAHDFIVNLPEGYSTVIGERGVRLSGGQRQRLGVVRGFLQNPSIILMDEPTSSVESESEEAVIAPLKALSRRRTTIVASHRPVFAENATEVLYLREGRVVSKGRHSDLWNTSSEYRTFMIRGTELAESPH